MRTRHFIRITVLSVFTFCIFSGHKVFSQTDTKIAFAETQVDTIEKQLDSILLIGIGSSVTRLFLDDLSDYFVHSLNDKKIAACYYYLGKSTKAAQKDFDTISKKGYKAILFFLPTGESVYDVMGNVSTVTSNTIAGPLSITIATSGIYYQQDFNFHLYIPGTDMKKVWSASVEVSCNPGKSGTAKEVGNKLLLCFKNNNYIP